MKHGFQPGNKFGKGRPKGSTYVEICKDWAEKKGWGRLIGWANGDGYKAGLKDGRFIELGPDLELQYQATKTLLEYGYGKPRQAVEVSGDLTVNLIDAIHAARQQRGLGK